MPQARQPEAVLIINPNAGRLAPVARDDVVALLRRRFRLEVITTSARHAGIHLAAEAAGAGAPLVIAFGGDGHVNEVANGIAGTRCTLGIVPGGTMNVFARALSVPLDPRGAVERIARGASAEPRVVPLGKMDDRYFTFSAGCGFDAEAAELVERDLGAKRRFGELFFYWSALRVLAGSYRHRNAYMTLRGEFGEVEAAMVVACNAGPYAYFLGRPVNLTPEVRLDGGLDLFALRSMRIEALPLYVWYVGLGGRVSSMGNAFHAHDLEKFELTATKPFRRHVDGEPLDDATSASFSLVRDALRVIP